MTVRRWLGALALATALLQGLASQASARDIAWGVNGHPLTSYPGVTVEQQLSLLQGLGARSYRVDVTSTQQIEPLVALVTAAKARGIQVLPILSPAVELEKQEPAALRRQAYLFARAVVSRLEADIPVWELGNEMENHAIIQPCEMRDDGTKYPCEWGPAGGVGPLDYHGPRLAKVIAVLQGLSDGVRSVTRTARRAVGSAGWGHVGFFERLQQAGVEWDISVWHMYKEDPEWAFKILAGYGKPIWVTEFNHEFGSHRDGEVGQAEGLVRTMNRLRELAPRYDVEAAHIYELLDETYWAPSFEASMGLVRLERRGEGWALGPVKPAFAAVRAAIAGAGR